MDTYREWLQVYPGEDDFWDGPWQRKFPIMELGTGDMLGIDLGDPQAVTYLNHDGDHTAHGFWLGLDFEDYIDRLSLLGCVGGEDWQIAPFLSGPRSLLEVEGPNARLWRDWFGIAIPYPPVVQ